MKIVGVLKYRDREGIGAMHKWLAEYKHNTLIRSSSTDKNKIKKHWRRSDSFYGI